MNRFPAHQLTEPVTVKPKTGDGAHGALFGDPVTTRCQYQGSHKVVRDASGSEVVSEVTLRLAPQTDPALDLEQLFRGDSKVTVRGRESRVIATRPYIMTGRLIYLEVNLT